LEDLRQALRSAGRGGADLHSLVEAVADQSDEEGVRRALAELERGGEAVEWNRRWYALRYTSWRVGRVEALRGGRALVRSGAAGEAGYLLRRGDLNGARDGDLVLVKPRRRKRRRHYSLPEASVSKVLERRWRSLVGRLVRAGRGWGLEPFDSRSQLDVRLDPPSTDLEGTLEEFDYVVVELLDRPAGDTRAWGRVTERLGKLEDPGVDALAVLRHFDIPEAFPVEVVRIADGLPESPTTADREGRLDLSDRTIVTIDGALARDFDDAISVETTASGGFRLGVHIADVSHYVPEGSPLDHEAYKRGTSVYFPERAVPMLPEALSNGLCSLRPDVPRLAVTVFLDIDRQGKVVGRRFESSWIRSRRRLTYGEVTRLLREPAEGDAEEYGAVLRLLEDGEELMERLLRRRLDQGSLDLDLPEVRLRLDDVGRTVEVRPAERTVAHRMIEEFMIAANEAVATELTLSEIPAVYRVHDPPGPDSYAELRTALASIGFTLPDTMETLGPEPLQRLLAMAEGRPQQPLISGLVLRAMQRAVYRAEDAGHFALAKRHYTHFTSPIRRYPDLVVHRRLKSSLAEGDPGSSPVAGRLERIAEWASRTERRAESAERELVKWKKIRFLEGRVGELFAGRITGVQPFGLFVELDGILVDGLIPVRSLADDYYRFEEERQRLIGEVSDRVFRLGDAVEVVLAEVDAAARSLEFALPGMPRPRRRRSGYRRSRDGA
jgi:ribonuclease R